MRRKTTAKIKKETEEEKTGREFKHIIGDKFYTKDKKKKYRSWGEKNLINILTYTHEMISKHRKKRTKKKTMHIDC